MSAHAYTEDQLVEQPAIGLFTELGWQTVSALEQAFGVTGTLLRETKGAVVLVSRLRVALERLNPALPPEASQAVVGAHQGVACSRLEEAAKFARPCRGRHQGLARYRPAAGLFARTLPKEVLGGLRAHL
jgi:hypothetical protein